VGASLAAWAVELAVDVRSATVRVERVVVSQDSGLIINPAGVRHQVQGNVIQTISRTLREQVFFDARGPVSLEWGGYPVLTFEELPEIEVILLERDDRPPLGVGESASVPGPAALANAIFDAVGIRLREVPFTVDRVFDALQNRGVGADCTASDRAPASV
jgi:nicotinate dehydrogenase subunit B